MIRTLFAATLVLASLIAPARAEDEEPKDCNNIEFRQMMLEQLNEMKPLLAPSFVDLIPVRSWQSQTTFDVTDAGDGTVHWNVKCYYNAVLSNRHRVSGILTVKMNSLGRPLVGWNRLN